MARYAGTEWAGGEEPAMERDKTELEALASEFADLCMAIGRNEEAIHSKQEDLKDLFDATERLKGQRAKIRASMMGILEPEEKAASDDNMAPSLGTERYGARGY